MLWPQRTGRFICFEELTTKTVLLSNTRFTFTKEHSNPRDSYCSLGYVYESSQGEVSCKGSFGIFSV